MKKRLFSLLLAVIMIVGLLPVVAMADTPAQQQYSYGTKTSNGYRPDNLAFCKESLIGASTATDTAVLASWQYDGKFYLAFAVSASVRDAVQAAQESNSLSITINQKTAEIDVLSFNSADTLYLYQSSGVCSSGRTAKYLLGVADYGLSNPYYHLFYTDMEGDYGDIGKSTPYYLILRAAATDVSLASVVDEVTNLGELDVKVMSGSEDLLKLDHPVIYMNDNSSHNKGAFVFGAILQTADGSYVPLRLESKNYEDSYAFANSSSNPVRQSWIPVGNLYLYMTDWGTSSGSTNPPVYLPDPYLLWDCEGYELVEVSKKNGGLCTPLIRETFNANYSGSRNYTYGYNTTGFYIDHNQNSSADLINSNGVITAYADGLTGNLYWNTHTGTMSMPSTYHFIFKEKEVASYTVEYYFETQTDGEFEKDEEKTETISGYVGETIAATPKDYDGFTYTVIDGLTVDEGTITNGTTAETLVLKLYYTRNSYDVTYMLDGVVYGTPESYQYGAEVTVAGAPVIPDGYSFGGWSTEDATVTDGKFDMPDQNVVLTGSTTANTDTDYKIEYYFENVAGTEFVKDESKTESKEGTTSETANADITKTFEGFTFDVNNENNVTYGTIAGDGSLVLKLYYERNSYTVTYRYEGTVPSDASDLPAEDTYRYDEEVTVAPAATAAGYTFSGWNRTGTFTMPAENVVIKGSFTANGDTPYTVKHHQQNLAGDDYVTVETENLTGATGTTATAVENVYEGFVLNEEDSTMSGTIAGDGSLVLNLYYDRKTYTVTYTDGVDDAVIFENDVHTVAYGSATPAFRGSTERAGYKFKGWEPAVADIVTGNAVYTAKWQKDYSWILLLGGNDVKVKGLNTEDHVAYVVGRGDYRFAPTGTVTRAEAATMFFRLLTDEYRAYYWDDNASYTDVADTAWYNVAIATLEEAGVIKDTDFGGNFRPNEPITRAEMAVMAAQFCTLSSGFGNNTFADVPYYHWAAREIALVQYVGWIQGYNGNYRPEDTITRAECVTIINRMLERGAETENMLPGMVTFVDVKADAWYYEAVQEAANSHTYTRTNWLMTNEQFCGEQWLTIEKAPDWVALEQAWAAANK